MNSMPAEGPVDRGRAEGQQDHEASKDDGGGADVGGGATGDDSHLGAPSQESGYVLPLDSTYPVPLTCYCQVAR